MTDWLWLTIPLVLLLLVASCTDVARDKTIYNWNTYPGILLGLVLNLALNGWDGLMNGFLGFLVCGGIMLFCFVLFSVGGGDLKMMAMVGSFLGINDGVEALLWTFVIGAVMGIGIVIWEQGFLNLTKRALHHFRLVLQAGGWVPLAPEEQKTGKKILFLAPAALLAVLIIQGQHLERLL